MTEANDRSDELALSLRRWERADTTLGVVETPRDELITIFGELEHVAQTLAKERVRLEKLLTRRSARGLERIGKKRWRKAVAQVIEEFRAALEPDYVVLGGGNADALKELPPRVGLGANENAFLGGFRLWDRVALRSGGYVEQARTGTKRR